MTTFATFMAMATSLLATRGVVYSDISNNTYNQNTYITRGTYTSANFYPQDNYTHLTDFNYYYNNDTDYVNPENATYGGNIRDFIYFGGTDRFTYSVTYLINLPNNQQLRFDVSRGGGYYAPIFRSYCPALTELYNLEIVFEFYGYYSYETNMSDFQSWSFTYPLYSYNSEALQYEQYLSGVGDYPFDQEYYEHYYLGVSCYIRNVDLSDYKDEVEGVAYDEGYDEGYATGKDDGFNLGQGSGNSFQNLFAVLVDTPIVFFRKLFGYELFGINLFAALTTVVSLLVALSIFRLVKGIF